jgi:hypothetical protein
MPVPNIFANVPGGTTIPLAELDENFAYCLANTTFTSANISGAATIAGLATLNGGLTLAGPLTIGTNTVSPNGITGTNLLVFNTSPTLVTPALGTPSSGNLSGCSGYPVSQVAGLATGVLPFLTNPTCANLALAVVDETGTGNLVFSNNPVLSSPSLTTPILGTPQNGNLVNCTSYPASGLSGVVPITIGGTGLSATGSVGQILAVTSANTLGYINAPPSVSIAGGLASQILYQSAPNTTAFIPNGTSGQVLISQGPNPPVWSNASVSSVTGILAIANGGTAATTAQAAINNLAGSVTNGNYLRGTGANVVMSPILVGDINALGTLSTNTTGSASTFTSTTQNSQFNSIGVNLAATGVAGEIKATGNIQTTTGFFSDGTGTLHPSVYTATFAATGTGVTIGGIPSWATKVTVFLSNVNKSSATIPVLRLGTSGGIVSAGYTQWSTSWAASVGGTTGFEISDAGGGFAAYGRYEIIFVNSNEWQAMFFGNTNPVNYIFGGYGSVTLPGALTQIYMTLLDGVSTFTSGSITVRYE